MTKNEATKILTDNGFTVVEADNRSARLLEGGEQVGILWEDRVILYLDVGYTNSVDLWYDKSDVKKKLKEAITQVKQRYERFDAEERNKRVGHIRKYFDEKREEASMADLLEKKLRNLRQMYDSRTG